MAEEEKGQEERPGREVAPSWAPDWIDRWFADFPRPRFWPDLWRGAGEGPHMIRVEEFTEGGEVVVRAEMPGIDPDTDVEITVADGLLRLRAERREEKEEKGKGRYRSEFRYGSFSRTIPLPEGTTEQDVKASYKDGILEVRIPVARERAEAKRIPIERG